MRNFLVIDFWIDIVNGKEVKKVNDKWYCNEQELISLAKYYYENSDVMDEIDLDNIENAIDFVKRADEVFEM
jgi:hypothetical protein